MDEDLRSIMQRRSELLKDKYSTTTQTIGNNMADQTPDIPVLTVDGVNYPIDSLPTDVQELITYYQTWKVEHDEQKLAAFKTEAAMRALSAEIQNRVRALVAQATAAMEESQKQQQADEAANDMHDAVVLDAEVAEAVDEALGDKESPTIQ